MIFNTDGFINRWTIGGTLQTGEDTTELQIWRPLSDSYVKIAAYKLNKENSVTVSQNVHEYYVSPAIPVATYDIVGVFQPSNTSAVSVYYQAYNGPSNIVIPVMAGFETLNRILTANLPTNAMNDYPLLSVHVSNTTVAMISSSTTETIEPTVSRMATDTTTYQRISTITRTLLPSQQRLVTTTQPSHSTSQVSHTHIISSTDGNLPFTTQHISTLTSVLFSSTQTEISIVSSIANEALLLSITLVGSIIIIVTLPLIVVILGACIYNRKRSRKTTSVELKEPTSVLNVRESMQDNPLYYYPVVPNHMRSNILVPPQSRQHQSHQPIEVVYDEIPLR